MRGSPRRRCDPEEGARHLALGADGPDPEVAAALESAARHARARGGPGRGRRAGRAGLRPDPGGRPCRPAPSTTRGRRIPVRRRRRGRGTSVAPGDDRRDAPEGRAGQDAVPARIDELDEPHRGRPVAVRAGASGSGRRSRPPERDPSGPRLGRVLPGRSRRGPRAGAGVGQLGRTVRSSPPCGRTRWRRSRFLEFLGGESRDADCCWKRSSCRTRRWRTSHGPKAPCTRPHGRCSGLTLMWSLRLDDARAFSRTSSPSSSGSRCTPSSTELLNYLAELECRAGHGGAPCNSRPRR